MKFAMARVDRTRVAPTNGVGRAQEGKNQSELSADWHSAPVNCRSLSNNDELAMGLSVDLCVQAQSVKYASVKFTLSRFFIFLSFLI